MASPLSAKGRVWVGDEPNEVPIPAFGSPRVPGLEGLDVVFTQASSGIDKHGRLLLSVRDHQADWSAFLKVPIISKHACAANGLRSTMG
jgi:hypothetical protein